MKIKNSINILFFALLLPICCFGNTVTAEKKITYVIEESLLDPNVLTISIARSAINSPTQLILSGTARGITSQVKNMTCDGKLIQEETPGAWTIPNYCRKIQWNIQLGKSGDELASAQQSIKSAGFILFSEVSSLPRIKDAGIPEVIKLSIPRLKSVFPVLNSLNEIPLPKANSAPLFVILNPEKVISHTSNKINLTYILDNKNAASKFPDMRFQLKGLEWLYAITKHQIKENFSITWLSVSADKVSVAGAAGESVLLVNYAANGELPYGNAMLQYVVLHEAFHQLVKNAPTQPPWVAESLASYYGIKAMQVALPNNPNTTKLIERFLAGADHFKDGLLIINRKVTEGDRSEYGAFYTKGLAFWIAVDEALKIKHDDLDSHLLDLLQIKYDSNGNPLNLQNILNLPHDVWRSLRHRFLD